MEIVSSLRISLPVVLYVGFCCSLNFYDLLKWNIFQEVDTWRLGCDSSQKIERPISISIRSEALKLVADLSLSMTVKSRSTWSLAMLAQKRSWSKKIYWESLVTVRSHWIRGSAIDRGRMCKTTIVSKKFGKRLLWKASITRLNSKAKAAGISASHMQTLRSLVLGGEGTGDAHFANRGHKLHHSTEGAGLL